MSVRFLLIHRSKSFEILSEMFSCRLLIAGRKTGDPLYQAIWADNGMFDQIIVSPSMFDDHMPNHVRNAMQQVGMWCSDL